MNVQRHHLSHDDIFRAIGIIENGGAQADRSRFLNTGRGVISRMWSRYREFGSPTERHPVNLKESVVFGVRLCVMYTNQELAEMHFMYGKADGNAALARRLYQERYPQRQYPDRKTFRYSVYRCPLPLSHTPKYESEYDKQTIYHLIRGHGRRGNSGYYNATPIEGYLFSSGFYTTTNFCFCLLDIIRDCCSCDSSNALDDNVEDGFEDADVSRHDEAAIQRKVADGRCWLSVVMATINENPHTVMRNGYTFRLLPYLKHCSEILRGKEEGHKKHDEDMWKRK
ncbi:hypothetical protein C0J52_26376 [Blattella germanica]|nr:hypothetical protein C0J52_26376 [Blattella germanica]